MAFVPVPKDLNRVKTKVMFNLTRRQLICFALAAAVGMPVFFLAKSKLELSAAAMVMVVIMLPFIFFALYEKDGQPAEKILGHVVKTMFLRDRVRPYRTDNLYAVIQREIKEKEELQIEQCSQKSGKAEKGAERRQGVRRHSFR
jgi:hypothetical protein